MRTLVVIESMWGNTRAVAEAVARGLGGDTTVIDVNQAPPTLPADVGLIVVGGPTHAFSMSRSSTQHDAVERGARDAHEGQGIREWLEQAWGSARSSLLP
jgi:flavodoxin